MGDIIVSEFFIQSAGIFTQVDNVDDCVVQYGSWRLNSWGYIYGNIGKYKDKCLHKIIAERMGLDVSKLTDHKDCDKTNNRRSNLREATREQNQMNRKINSNNKSGYKGVYWNKVMQKWEAVIRVDGKQIHLGYYDYAEQAHLYYCIAAIKHFGEFARFE